MNPRVATASKSPDSSFDPPVRGDLMVESVFLKLCEKSKTPLGNLAFNLWKEGDFGKLTNLPLDPFFYVWNKRDADFELDYQIACFFKKYQGFDLGIDKEKLAYDKWLKAESRCGEINAVFRSRWMGESHFSHPVEEVFYLARRKITEILGTVGPRDLDIIRTHSRHGPGADTELRRRDASLYSKYQQQGSITPACAELFDDIFNSEESLSSKANFAHDAKYALNSKLSFVPKTARIDRAICVEPRWNVYLQLGIGDLIAKRLRRYGQDIQNQVRNQEAARRAYSENLATIDLSSASDSISLNLVIDLLSTADPYWTDLLLKSRTAYSEYCRRSIRLEKISSMGNGYTFPLETLIFYAFAYATCRFEQADTRQVNVYGDDIIVPRKAYSLLVESLECFGFTVNTDKSYANGCFFESCGCDFYKGREVRPFFVKKKVDRVSDAMVLHNQIIDWAQNNQVLPGLMNHSRWLLAYQCIYRRVPRSLQFCGPLGMSGVFHTEFSRWTISRSSTVLHRRRGMEGCYIRALVPLAEKKKVFGYRGLLYSKISVDVDSGHEVTILCDSPFYRLKDMLVPLFPDFVVDNDEARGMSTAIW